MVWSVSGYRGFSTTSVTQRTITEVRYNPFGCGSYSNGCLGGGYSRFDSGCHRGHRKKNSFLKKFLAFTGIGALAGWALKGKPLAGAALGAGVSMLGRLFKFW